MSLLMVFCCFGSAFADAVYPTSRITFPFGSSMDKASQLTSFTLAQSAMQNEEVAVVEGQNLMPSLTNLETDDVVYATSFYVEKGGSASWPKYNVYAKFPTLTENGEWNLLIPAGSLKAVSTGALNPAYSQVYTLEDPSLDVDAITPVSLSPAAGSEIRAVGKAQGKWSIAFEPELQKQIGFIAFTLTDADPAHQYLGEPFHRQGYVNRLIDADGNPKDISLADPIEIYWGGADAPMYNGYEYKFRVEARTQEYDGRVLGVFECIYKGATAPYEYAVEKCTLITPSPQDYDPSNPEGYVFEDTKNNVIRMVFDGPVECVTTASGINTGFGTNVSFSSITSNTDKTEWSLTLPVSEIHAPAVLWFAAFTGSNGNRVQGNYGRGDVSMFSYGYLVDVGLAELSFDPPAGSELESISRITVSADDVMNLLRDGAHVTLMDMHGSVVYTFDDNKIEFNGNKAVLVADPVFATPGSYVLNVPKKMFTVGEEFNSKNNAAANVPYTIKDNGPADAVYDYNAVTVNPADKAEVESLDTVLMYFAEGTEAGIESYDAVPLLNAAGEIAAYANFTPYYDPDDWNAANGIEIKFSSDERGNNKIKITTPGTYTLNVPKAKIRKGMTNSYNEAVTLTWTVKDPYGLILKSSDPANYAEIESLDKVSLVFDTENALAIDDTIEVMLVNNERANVAYAQFGAAEAGTVEVTFTSDVEGSKPMSVTSTGNYTLRIPKGKVKDAVTGNMNAAINLGWIVSREPAYSYTFTPSAVSPADKAEVESLKTIKLTFASWPALGADDSKASLTDADGNVVAEGMIALDDNDFNAVNVILPEEITTPGTYSMVIAQGIIISNDSDTNRNPELSYSWTVKAAQAEPTFTFTPTEVAPADKAEVKSIDKVVLTFASAAKVAEGTEVSLTSANGYLAATGTMTVDAVDSKLVNIVFPKPVEDLDGAEYMITIEKGMITEADDENNSNPELSYTWTIKTPNSISGIYFDNGVAGDVYNMQGVLVLRDATVSDLEKLDKGIYLVKGKKFVIK